MAAERKFAMTTKWKFLFHVVAPVSFGALVYLMFRPQSLPLFSWMNAVGLEEMVSLSRAYSVDISLPSVIVYSIPNALWVYATTAWLYLVWSEYSPWLLTGIASAVGFELGQLAGITPGTYDGIDLLACIGAFAAACLFLQIPHRREDHA